MVGFLALWRRLPPPRLEAQTSCEETASGIGREHFQLAISGRAPAPTPRFAARWSLGRAPAPPLHAERDRNASCLSDGRFSCR